MTVPGLVTTRHEPAFSSRAFAQKRINVSVIGVGALGSRIVRHLGQLGVPSQVFDPDVVEEVNVANQAYGLDDVGKPKVAALAEMVRRTTGIELTQHQRRFEGGETLRGVVFVATDDMDRSRIPIWQRSVKLKVGVPVLIECRMGMQDGRIYAVNPRDPAHIREYEKTLYRNEEAADRTRLTCSRTVSVGPTAEYIASIAVWQFIRWFAIEQGYDDRLENESIVMLRPLEVFTRFFE